jgi:hypothetical protein
METPRLSPKAAERLAREAATQPFDAAAKALNLDWGTGYDGTQIERYARALGDHVLEEQEAELEAYERGQRPEGPKNDPLLLVIGMDGGRVQEREKDAASGSRWHENKVLTITSYLPGDGKDRPPQALVTTYLATMAPSADFGKLARLEAERRGIRQATRVQVLGDAGNWIDTLHQEHFPCHPRTVDYAHACEHLHDAARAAYPAEEVRRNKLAEDLETLLWDGQVAGLLKVLRAHAGRLGTAQAQDPEDHPRRVLAQEIGYFERHGAHMNYPEYRRRGWPIGSGITESGVKLFNKRVKGTEQFWSPQGVEAILALRAMWLSQDQRWDHYWLWGRTRTKVA